MEEKTSPRLREQAGELADWLGVNMANHTRRPPSDRFWEKVEQTGDCWLWTAGTWRSRRGDLYGQFWDGVNKTTAHRFAYRLTYGPIPDGHQIDHRCHNTLCVRPEHLRAVTQEQNGQNRRGANRTSLTGIRGVSPTKYGKWIVHVGHNGRTIYVGTFDDVESANQAAIEGRNRLFTHNDADRQMVP